MSKEQIKDLQESVAALTNLNNQLKADANAVLASENEDLKKQVAELTEANTALAEQQNKVRMTANGDLVEANSNLAGENKELRSINKKLKTEYETLEKQIKSKTPLKIKGFLLETDDPFGAGAMRAYIRLDNKTSQPAMLPFVLPYNEKGRAALESYIVRAEGAGDYARVASAKDALKKCK